MFLNIILGNRLSASILLKQIMMELLVVIKNYWRSIFFKNRVDNMHLVIGSYSRLYNDASL